MKIAKAITFSAVVSMQDLLQESVDKKSNLRLEKKAKDDRRVKFCKCTDACKLDCKELEEIKEFKNSKKETSGLCARPFSELEMECMKLSEKQAELKEQIEAEQMQYNELNCCLKCCIKVRKEEIMVSIVSDKQNEMMMIAEGKNDDKYANLHK